MEIKEYSKWRCCNPHTNTKCRSYKVDKKEFEDAYNRSDNSDEHFFKGNKPEYILITWNALVIGQKKLHDGEITYRLFEYKKKIKTA